MHIFYWYQLIPFKLYQILIILPTRLLNDFKYLIDDYHYQLEFTSFRSTSLNGTLAYVIPMSIIIGSYIYTLRKIRRDNNNFGSTNNTYSTNDYKT